MKNDHSLEASGDIFKKMESDLSGYLFDQKEQGFIHATLNEEMSDFRPVRDGDVKEVKKNLVKHRDRVFPKLSDSPVQQQKYLFVSSITSCCRFCIEGGMPSDESYGLSDLYIRKMDKCRTVDEVKDVYEEMMLDYAQRMQQYSIKSRTVSPKIAACINYIENHMHDRITVKELAEEIEMNESWLSTLFAKEVGVSVSEYIRQKKLTAAKHLLSYNEYSCSDISQYLGFSSESHFSAVFSKSEHMTPKEYRKKHFSRHFTNLKEKGE